MSGVISTMVHGSEDIAKWFGFGKTFDKAGSSLYGTSPQYASDQPQQGPPAPPTQDTAANAAAQQANLLRRRRGILGTIYAGNNAAAPAVSTKSNLGN